MLYWLFSLRLPFWAADEVPVVTKVEHIAEIVSSAPIRFDGVYDSMSVEGVDFMTRVLTRPEGERLSVDEALAHPWLSLHVPEARPKGAAAALRAA